MKLRKLAVAFVLLVALFAASVVPVVACNREVRNEQRSASQLQWRPFGGHLITTERVNPSSIFFGRMYAVGGRVFDHTGWLGAEFSMAGSFSYTTWRQEFVPGGNPAVREVRTRSGIGIYNGWISNTACPGFARGMMCCDVEEYVNAEADTNAEFYTSYDSYAIPYMRNMNTED